MAKGDHIYHKMSEGIKISTTDSPGGPHVLPQIWGGDSVFKGLCEIYLLLVIDLKEKATE